MKRRKRGVFWFNKNLERDIKIWKLKDKNISTLKIAEMLGVGENNIKGAWERFNRRYRSWSQNPNRHLN